MDLPALLPLLRKVCCGFLSPLKIHCLGWVRIRNLWFQWQAHYPLYHQGDYTYLTIYDLKWRNKLFSTCSFKSNIVLCVPVFFPWLANNVCSWPFGSRALKTWLVIPSPLWKLPYHRLAVTARLAVQQPPHCDHSCAHRTAIFTFDGFATNKPIRFTSEQNVIIQRSIFLRILQIHSSKLDQGYFTVHRSRIDPRKKCVLRQCKVPRAEIMYVTIQRENIRPSKK
jgi:hypothetical protein